MSKKRITTAKKQGGASIFIVVFTIIILSIIVLGFTRLTISETTKTTNTDLSQSAYDSALAGVEDAKIALLKYHKCLDDGYKANKSGGECEKIIYYMQEGIRTNDCSTIQKVLGRYREDEDHSVIVQETQDSFSKGNNASMLQAYTCVTIQEELSDYRTTLTSSSRLRIIPLRSSEGKPIEELKLKWFSPINLRTVHGQTSHYCVDHLYSFGQCSGGEQAPTTLIVRLIQTDATFNLSELSASSSSNSTDTGSLMLIPSLNNGGNATSIEANKWGESANKGENNPIRVNCKTNQDWFCTANIELPKTFNGRDEKHAANSYLLVSIPYGSPETDISLSTFTDDQGISKFTGVQARIDSTGRANDLYRRVETRLELVDTYYPYPEFEINITSGSDYVLKKTFYITLNCWGADNGYAFRCDNNHENDSFAELP